MVKYLTDEFPPTYITDGNASSFQEQGIAFKDKLEKSFCTSKMPFFNKSKQEITHEYQFDYSKSEAKKCYYQTLYFIEQHKISS